MYNFLTLKTVRLLAALAIVLFIICGIWINYAFDSGTQIKALASMV